jgi:hypothetical protein
MARWRQAIGLAMRRRFQHYRPKAVLGASSVPIAAAMAANSDALPHGFERTAMTLI